MRPIIMVLSIFRVPFQVRTASIAFLCALLLAAFGISVPAQSPRAHRTSQTAHHRPQNTRLHTARRTSSSRASARAAHTTPVRRRAPRSRAAIVHTSMPIRRYRWMSTRSAASSVHFERAAESETAAETQKPGVPTPATSVAEAEVADSNDANAPTAQDAANQIAANEFPASHSALAAPVAAAVDPFRSTRIIAMAPLRGSLESLIRQNEKNNTNNLERIEDDAELQTRISNGQLVRVPESAGLSVNPNLPTDRRYCRPWTATFLTDLSHAHETQFHRGFEVSSAVRTVEYQKHLMRTNGNAAPAEGDIASPHLTGATIDIAKHGLTRSEIYWMRNRLDALQNEGKIDVEEEFRQSCFHITVYKSYIGAGPLHKPTHPVTQPVEDPDTTAAPTDTATPGA